MYCQKCGKENPDTNQFCGGCGADLKNIDQNTTQKKIEINSVAISEKEKRMSELYLRIKETKDQIAKLNDNTVVYVVAAIGAILILFLGIGILIILIDIVWVILREREAKQLDHNLFEYESEISRLKGY